MLTAKMGRAEGWRIRWQPLIVMVAILFLVSNTVAPSPPPAGTSPRFVAARCPFTVNSDLVEGKNVHCGYLIVPENRTRPNGKTIRLAVAIFKSQAARRAPDPVIYLAGGPGASLVGSVGPTINATTALDLLGDRDLILIDQRGAGLSQPSLACPELKRPFVSQGSTLAARLGSQIAFRSKATSQCRDRLIRQGIDLDAYNTPANAADIADLSQALGLKRVNLYGGSYGSRLALAVMRDHPERIRSVVIDAVADPKFNQFTDAIPNFWRSLQLVFTQCAQSPTCNQRYPRLSQLFTDLVSRLNTKPVTIDGSVLDGATLANGLMVGLYRDSVIPQIPQLLTELYRGKYGPAIQIGKSITASEGESSDGMYLAMECGDDLAGALAQGTSLQARRLPTSIRSLMVASSYTSYVKQCLAWQAKPVAEKYHQPIVSTIPTLIMSSEFDPRTPPANGRRVARTLSRSSFFVYPGLGHGARFHNACPNSMVWDFLDHPLRRPSSACLATMPKPFN